MGQTDTRPLVLVVDDNTGHIELLRMALAMRYRVVTATNGADAYAVACRERPDAILLDLMMPIAGGYSVARQLGANAETAGIPIVLVTALDPSEFEGLPDRVAVSAVLRKPCHQGEILDAIKAVLPLPPER
jgi:CheY-like chemotaxis protein